MRLTVTLAAATFFGLVASVPSFAQDDPSPEAAGMSREEVLKSTTNMVGEPITYPTGTAEVTTEMVTLEPGGQTGYHTHQVPSWVYVLDGELELRIGGQEPMRFTSGQAFVEPQGTAMQAFNVADGPTQLLVVSMGAEGQPTGQPAVPASE
jgi:quercetin dioxygenase-like cupin family protein